MWSLAVSGRYRGQLLAAGRAVCLPGGSVGWVRHCRGWASNNALRPSGAAPNLRLCDRGVVQFDGLTIPVASRHFYVHRLPFAKQSLAFSRSVAQMSGSVPSAIGPPPRRVSDCSAAGWFWTHETTHTRDLGSRRQPHQRHAEGGRPRVQSVPPSTSGPSNRVLMGPHHGVGGVSHNIGDPVS